MAKQLDNEQKAAIKNYGKRIVTLETFAEAVRKLPGFYLGGKGNKCISNQFREIFQNAIDQILQPDMICDTIWVEYDERNFTFTIRDNGKGIPFGNLKRIFMDEHTSSNYTKESGQYTSGMHGVGSKVVNALSDLFVIESYIFGEARRMEFRKGVPIGDETTIPNKGNIQGTKVTFIPSMDILESDGETITYSAADVEFMIMLILPLSRIGSKCEFSYIDKSGKADTKVFVNNLGLYEYINRFPSQLIKPILLENDNGTLRASVLFSFNTDIMQDSVVTSFANFCPTVNDKSTHYEGMMLGICDFFTKYMNTIFLASIKDLKKKKQGNPLTVTNADVRDSIIGVISAAHIHPTFDGQAKNVFTNADMKGFVRSMMVNGLDQWSKANPGDLTKVCRYLKDIASTRLAVEEKKTTMAKKYNDNPISGFPSGFTNTKGKLEVGDEYEFIIVEGKSAEGTAKNARKSSCQALLPIRGKLPNALNTKPIDFELNSEINAIKRIVGGGWGKHFDISKVKWGKIIAFVDADPDGDHIAMLLLIFFYVYMRPILEAGRYYKAMPPLYGTKLPNGQYEYFGTMTDYLKYVQYKFAQIYNLTTANGKPLTPSEMVSLLYKNVDYKYYIETEAHQHALNERLLEISLIYRNDPKILKKAIESTFRFMNVDISNPKNIIIGGTIDKKVQTMFLNERFIKTCKSTIDYIDNVNTTMEYNLNGKMCGIYDIMATVDTIAGKDIQRYKGLGEMDTYQLRESAMYPGMGRTLIRYTVEDAERELREIKFLNDNKRSIMSDSEIAKLSRSDILG